MKKAIFEPRRITLRILLNSAMFFLIFMNLFVIFLYTVGSIQGFMDSTLLFLLNLTSFLGLILAAVALFGFANAIFMIYRKERSPGYIGRALLYLLPAILGVFAALASILIMAAAGGNTA